MKTFQQPYLLLTFIILALSIPVNTCNASTVLAVDHPKYLEDSPTMILSNVHIVDIENRRVIKNQDILIEGDRIREIKQHEPSPKYQSDTVIQGNGSFVIPALSDMHHHLTSSDFDFTANTPGRQAKILEEQIKYGIQGILNPNISLEAVNYLKAGSKELNEVLLEMTGPSIGPKNGWGSHQVSTKEEITTIIDTLLEMGIRTVKFTYDDMSWLGGQMPVLNSELLKHIVEYAHSKGMKTMAHVTDLERAKELLRYGLDGLVHGIVSDRVDEEFLELLKANNAFYIPTTAVYETSFNFQQSVKRQFEYNIWEEFSEEFTDSLSNDASRDMWNSWWPKAASLKTNLSHIYWNTKAVYDSGNLVMMGSDTGTPGVLPGISAYYEMELMEESGLSPYEVLECAVVSPMKYFGRYPLQGLIKNGAKANMMLLENDPTVSVRFIKSAKMVIHNGKIVSSR